MPLVRMAFKRGQATKLNIKQWLDEYLRLSLPMVYAKAGKEHKSSNATL
jgi:hypothetical protein